MSRIFESDKKSIVEVLNLSINDNLVYIFLIPAFSSESRAHIDSTLFIISANYVFSTESRS